MAMFGVAATAIVLACELSGNSLGRFIPLESVMGVGEIAAWFLVIGDDADSRELMYVWGFPFAAAWNGALGWLIGYAIRWLISTDESTH